MARVKKKERQQLLLAQVKDKPFLTDEELAKNLDVSVQTIRLDRLELGIPELRGRIRKMAETAQNKVKALRSGEVVGELIDLELGHSGISLLRITEDMVFAKTQIGGDRCAYGGDGSGQCQVQGACACGRKAYCQSRDCESAGQQVFCLGQDPQ